MRIEIAMQSTTRLFFTAEETLTNNYSIIFVLREIPSYIVWGKNKAYQRQRRRQNLKLFSKCP